MPSDPTHDIGAYVKCEWCGEQTDDWHLVCPDGLPGHDWIECDTCYRSTMEDRIERRANAR